MHHESLGVSKMYANQRKISTKFQCTTGPNTLLFSPFSAESGRTLWHGVIFLNANSSLGSTLVCFGKGSVAIPRGREVEKADIFNIKYGA